LFDSDDILLIINNNNEVTNYFDILNVPVGFGENQLESTENTNNLPTKNQLNNVSIQSRYKYEPKLIKNKLSKLNWKEAYFCLETQFLLFELTK